MECWRWVLPCTWWPSSAIGVSTTELVCVFCCGLCLLILMDLAFFLNIRIAHLSWSPMESKKSSMDSVMSVLDTAEKAVQAKRVVQKKVRVLMNVHYECICSIIVWIIRVSWAVFLCLPWILAGSRRILWKAWQPRCSPLERGRPCRWVPWRVLSVSSVTLHLVLHGSLHTTLVSSSSSRAPQLHQHHAIRVVAMVCDLFSVLNTFVLLYVLPAG